MTHNVYCRCQVCRVDEANAPAESIATELTKARRSLIENLAAELNKAEGEAKELNRQLLASSAAYAGQAERAKRSEAYAAEVEAKNKRLIDQTAALADGNDAYRRQVASLTAELDHVRGRLDRATILLQTPKEEPQ